jgi:SAM-dependent methyltransferase
LSAAPPGPRAPDYRRQARGDRGAYDRYLRGMDASMKQKVALTAAHLLGVGTVADMGMGSGTGSAALAALYPGLDVVGVDVSPEMTGLARERHRATNLAFVCADIASPCFRPASLDGIFDSSVLHHVTTFTGYDHGAASRCLEVQAAELREGGVLIVRDFADPGPGEVLLDLRTDDGDGSGEVASCSSAALLERFAREFRPLSPSPGFPLIEVSGTPALPLPEGVRRFRLSYKHAVEFVLRKDYRRDWATEVLEEYTYFTQAQFEEAFTRLGLRLLASIPIRNPWIVRHRMEGRIAIHDLHGRRLDHPPTNFLIAGEKVAPGDGVYLREVDAPASLPSFLRMDHHRDRRTGQVRDLASRPHLTVDVLPWFVLDGDPYVLARRGYPRPILRCRPRGTPSLDGSRAAEYVTEPLTVLQRDEPLGRTVETALARAAGIGADRIRGMRPGRHYYTSPGGIEEEVRSVFVEVDPVFVERPLGPVSGFRTSGIVRAIEARQLLRAAQVGALPDSRLELNVYGLLARLGLEPGAWIGEELKLSEGPAPASVASWRDLARRPPRRTFARAPAEASPGFLGIHAAVFEECAADGTRVAERTLEFVLPAALSFNTISVALLRRSGGAVYLGLDDDDLPAAQAFSGASELLVAPAWRLPREVDGIASSRAWVRERLAREYGLTCGEVWELGGRYHPSPGLTPEVVHPLALEVGQESDGERRLLWVRLEDVAAHTEEVRDGHLLTLALRAAHALGTGDLR